MLKYEKIVSAQVQIVPITDLWPWNLDLELWLRLDNWVIEWLYVFVL